MMHGRKNIKIRFDVIVILWLALMYFSLWCTLRIKGGSPLL